MIDNYSDVVIIIPARLESTRLLEKPMQYIGNMRMIEHVVSQVKDTGIKNIYVATNSECIAQQCVKYNVQTIIINTNCNSGTDRVFLALKNIDNYAIRYVINVQCDMPFIDSNIILKTVDYLKLSHNKIVTPVSLIGKEIAENENVVKVVVDHNDHALYFSRRLIPFSLENLYLGHIGIYGFQKSALYDFVKFVPCKLEISERLEQLRALYYGVKIGVCYVDNFPISVDSESDLMHARTYYDSILK